MKEKEHLKNQVANICFRGGFKHLLEMYTFIQIILIKSDRKDILQKIF